MAIDALGVAHTATGCRPRPALAVPADSSELVAQLAHIDALVVNVGTGGHSAGIGAVLRGFFPDLRTVGVDTTGSTIFGQTAGTRLMSSLGSSIYPGNVA